MAKARAGTAAKRIVNVRLAPDEEARIEAAAKYHGVPVSEFMRRAALAACRRIEAAPGA